MVQRRFSLRYQGARLRALGKRRGSPWLRARIWNWEFRAGQWTHLEHSEDRPLYEILTRFLEGGHLLDLGCGNGPVRCELPSGSFTRYVGVDISAEAIKRTGERSRVLPDLPDGQLLIVGDITDSSVLARAAGSFDVVLLRESLYYLNEEWVPDFLSRVAELLTQRGVIVVKIHDRHRYAGHIRQLRQTRAVIEERSPANSTTMIIVVR